MSLSGLFRIAAVAVPVSLAGGGAIAQQVMTPAPGMIVVVLPAGERVAAVKQVPIQPMAIERIFAEQQAMMTRMIADMHAMFNEPSALTNPMTTITAGNPGEGTLVCQESMSITYNGPNSQPLVKVSHAGNGCGPSVGGGPVTPAEVRPSVPSPAHSRVLEISDPAREVVPAVNHRT